MPIPLYLKLKGHRTPQTAPPLFDTVSDTAVSYNARSYSFCKIFAADAPDSQFDILHDNSASGCTIFMGPTGSGKTTTLRKVILSRAAQLAANSSHATMTAFEVAENKHLSDLLDGSARKDYNAATYESSLKQERASAPLVEQVFSRRSTSRTSFNELSSRSCLVVTFHYGTNKHTYIDLMGNEKYDRALASPTADASGRNSNSFANMNMSSITHLLSKKSVSGRSANLITNLIFKNGAIGNIKVVLTLDQYGDASLVKSSFNNVASLIQDFELGSPLASPVKKSRIPLPSYARPTLSSLSPPKSSPAALATSTPSVRRKVNTPAKMKVVPSLNRSSLAPKFAHASRPSLITNTPTRVAMQDMNSSPISRQRSHAKEFSPSKMPVISSSAQSTPKDSVRSMRSLTPPLSIDSTNPSPSVLSLAPPVSTRVSSTSAAKKVVARPKIPVVTSRLTSSDVRSAFKDLQCDHQKLKDDHMQALRESQDAEASSRIEIEDLKLINSTNQALISQQKEIMNAKLGEIKQDFKAFKSQHGNFKATIESLKISLGLMEEENMNLKDLNSIQSAELIAFNDQVELFEFNHSNMKYEAEKARSQAEAMKEKVVEMEKSNLQLLERDSEKEVIILENTKELCERHDEIVEKEEQLSIKDTLISEKNEQLDNKDRVIAELMAQLSEVKQQLDSKDQDLVEKDGLLNDLNGQLSEKDCLLKDLNSQLSEKDYMSSIMQDELASKEMILAQKEQSLCEMDQEIVGKSAEINSLVEENQNLNQELKSYEKQILDLQFNEEIETLQQESQSKTEQIESLQQEVQSKSEQISYLSSQVAEFDVAVHGREASVAQLSEELSEAKRSLAAKIDEAKAMAEENGRLVCESQQLSVSNATDLAIKDNEIHSISQEIDEKQMEIESQNQEILKLNEIIDERTEEIVQLANELKKFRYNQESKMEDLHDELANTSSELISKDDQISELENDKDALVAQVNDLKDQLATSVAHFTKKYESMVKTKDETISKLKQELVEEIRSPLITNIDMNSSLNSLARPFDPSSDIFQDNILSQSSRDSSLMENESCTSISSAGSHIESPIKRILAPSKMENYKSVISAMSKDKKKRRHRVKNKVGKVSTSCPGSAVSSPKHRISC